MLILLISLLSFLGSILALLHGLLGCFTSLSLCFFSSFFGLLSCLLDLILRLLLEIIDRLRSLARLCTSCWWGLGAWLIAVDVTSGLSSGSRCFISVCLDLSLSSIFNSLLCLSGGCLSLFVSGLLFGCLSFRLGLVSGKLLLSLFLISLGLFALLLILHFLLFGFESFLFGYLFLFSQLLLSFLLLLLVFQGLPFIDSLLFFLLLGLLSFRSLFLGNLLLEFGGRLGNLLATRASVLLSFLLVLGGGLRKAGFQLLLLLLLLGCLIIGSLRISSCRLLRLSFGSSLLSLPRLLLSLLFLLFGDLVCLFLGLFSLIFGLLLGLLLLILELLRLNFLLRIELLLLGLHLGFIGSLFHGISRCNGGSVDARNACGGNLSHSTSLFGATLTDYTHFVGATHAIIQLLEDLGHGIGISSGLDVVEAIVGLKCHTVLVFISDSGSRHVAYSGQDRLLTADYGSGNGLLDNTTCSSWLDNHGLLACCHDVRGKSVNLTELIVLQLCGGIVNPIMMKKSKLAS